MPHPQESPVLQDDGVVGLAEESRDDVGQAAEPGRHRLAGEERPQVGGEGAGRGIAEVGRLLQRLQRDQFQITIDTAIDRARRRRIRFEHRQEGVHRAGRLERGAAGEHLIEDRSQAPDIARRADVAATPGRLLRRHVARGAEDGACVRHRGIGLEPLGQPEVGDARAAVGVDEDVGGLQVAVEDAARMGRLDGLGHLRQDRRPLARVHRPACQTAGQRRPLDILHRVEGVAVEVADLEDRDDPRMVEPGGGLRLAAEAGQIGLRGELAAKEHLHRDGAPQAPLPGPVDDPHAAAADLLEEVVVAERRREGDLAGGEAVGRLEVAMGRVRRRRGGRIVGTGRGGAAGEDLRFVRHRVGEHHRREQLTELRREIGMDAGERLEPHSGGARGTVGKLVEEAGQPLFLGHRERLLHGAAPPARRSAECLRFAGCRAPCHRPALPRLKGTPAPSSGAMIEA